MACCCGNPSCTSCHDNKTDPTWFIKCCKCYEDRFTQPVSQIATCFRYAGSGYGGTCTSFNTTVILTAKVGVYGANICTWACTLAAITATLDYYSMGDYWEFVITDGTHTVKFRAAGADFTCDGGGTLTLFSNTGCTTVPPSASLGISGSGGTLKDIIICCPDQTLPDTVHVTFGAIGTGDCGDISGQTVALVKTVNPGGFEPYTFYSWTGDLPLSDGRTLHISFQCGGSGTVQNYLLVLTILESGNCTANGLVCTADCDSTCNPLHITFNGCTLMASIFDGAYHCPNCFGMDTTFYEFGATVTV